MEHLGMVLWLSNAENGYENGLIDDEDDDGDGDEDDNDDDDDNHWAVGQWESRSRGSPHLKIIIIKIIR